MWNVKCFVIPVITGATGIVTRGLQTYLRTIPGRKALNDDDNAKIQLTLKF